VHNGPSDNLPEDWPVLPAGVERVLLFRAHGSPPPEEDCFVCGEAMPHAESGEMCWYIPGRGPAHERCYEPEDADS
jgi:hypothetical protein